MKKFIVALSIISILTHGIQAQDAVSASKAVYGEIGGSGLVFSANYDMRFKGHKGLGFRAGVGYASSLGESIITFPLGINALAGKGPHYVEFGASATLATAEFGGFDEGSSAWFFHPHVGYRYSKPHNSINARIYVGPIIASGFAFFPFGGISVGYTLPNKNSK